MRRTLGRVDSETLSGLNKGCSLFLVAVVALEMKDKTLVTWNGELQPQSLLCHILSLYYSLGLRLGAFPARFSSINIFSRSKLIAVELLRISIPQTTNSETSLFQFSFTSVASKLWEILLKLL